MSSVLSHNQRAGATWGSGGAAYDVISESIADGIDHVVNRVWPSKGERFLDIATGTGWTARRLAARGAVVTGVDIGEGVIEAAKRFASAITFEVGDAEALPFPDGVFDGVTSTYGVMFVSHPEVAAAEIGRVTRTGGRLGLVTWLPGGAVEDIFLTMRPFMAPPPANAPPSGTRSARSRTARGSVRPNVRTRHNGAACAERAGRVGHFRHRLWPD
jgi:SAM-dependent methyltransferase